MLSKAVNPQKIDKIIILIYHITNNLTLRAFIKTSRDVLVANHYHND